MFRTPSSTETRSLRGTPFVEGPPLISSLFVSDPRIDDSVENVRHEVGGDYRESYDEEHCLHDGKILVLHRVKQPFAKAGPIEDCLSNDCAAQNASEGERAGCYYRERCVLESMPHQNRTLPKPLRPSGQDIVFAESLPHSCPRQEKETTIGERRKSQSGKKQVLQSYENLDPEVW